jgi:hypothetical protein
MNKDQHGLKNDWRLLWERKKRAASSLSLGHFDITLLVSDF